jgi:hypothetical protein
MKTMNGTSAVHDVVMRAKKQWALIAQAGAWIFGIVASFLSPLPYDFDFATVTGRASADSTAQVAGLGRFVVIVLAGLFLLPALRWKAPRYAWRWGALSLLLLTILLGSFFMRDRLTSACVVTYRGSQLLIGDKYTPEAASYLKSNQVTTRELIDQFNVSRMDKIWTTDSMFRCRRRLLALYFWMLPVAVITLLATLQTIGCIGVIK